MFLAKHSDFIRKDGYRELNAWSRFDLRRPQLAP